MRARIVLSTSAALLLAASCDPITICGCSPPPEAAVLYGTVTGPGGAPVAGAGLAAEVSGPGCAPPVDPLGHDPAAVSGADGTFRLTVFAPRYIRPGDCLRALAAPPPGSNLRAAEPVPFAVRFGPGPNLDSARVDLVLRAP
jgi:hypothetical protein